MSGVEVAAVVAGILCAFTSGMDIFRKIRQRGKTKLKKPRRQIDEESRLELSLTSRPKEIGDEYRRSFERLGDAFARGDPRAQASLAQTLLVMNSGLTSILSTALSDDGKSRDVGRRSLLSLSERSSADVKSALKQLRQRLQAPNVSLRPLLAPIQERSDQGRVPGSKGKNKDQKRGMHHGHKRHGTRARNDDGQSREGRHHTTSPRPKAGSTSTTRAEWVRSTKGASLASLATTLSSSTVISAKKPSEPRSRPHHKRTNSSLSTGSSQQFPGSGKDARALNNSDLPQTMPTPTDKKRRKVDTPPLPNKIEQAPPPIPRTPVAPRRPTPSMFSFMSDSTKIGEIPEHKWITMPPEHDDVGPWPGWGLLPQPAEQKNRKGRFGALKFWRRRSE